MRTATPPDVCAHLFLLLQCDRPATGGGRFRLHELRAVTINRAGERAAELETDNGARTLNLGIPDKRMSSTHLRLESILGKWFAMDDDSKNGSFVNGERIVRVELRDGDVVSCGRTAFIYRNSLPVDDRPAVLWSNQLDGPLGFDTLLPELNAQLAKVRAVAGADVPVVVNGETGTGKELIARGVHQLSGRAGTLVAVNCSGLPDTLIEGELFGHTRGAFSGATGDRPGHVRSADKGTLFLDEIADLPASSQGALLRVLQEGEVVPLGSSRPVRVDVRLVAATHRDLAAMVAAGEFRQDLLARLSGYRVVLPPLRERREDFGMLVASLLAQMNLDVELSVPAARALMAHNWPNNIRELGKCLQAAAALAIDGVIGVDCLPPDITTPTAPAPRLSAADARLREDVIAALRANDGNITNAAKSMGKARQQMQRWLKRFDLDPAEYRS